MFHSLIKIFFSSHTHMQAHIIDHVLSSVLVGDIFLVVNFMDLEQILPLIKLPNFLL
jgi:hypothetical protein